MAPFRFVRTDAALLAEPRAIAAALGVDVALNRSCDGGGDDCDRGRCAGGVRDRSLPLSRPLAGGRGVVLHDVALDAAGGAGHAVHVVDDPIRPAGYAARIRFDQLDTK